MDDYSIDAIESYLGSHTITASRLIWQALIKAESRVAKARYRPNQKYPLREEDSQLVHHLKLHAWIPDRFGTFRKPYDMTSDDLLTDFPYDDRNGLLTAIGFGEKARKCSAEYQDREQDAVRMGFPSAKVAALMAEMAKVLEENGKSPAEALSQLKADVSKEKPAFPTGSVLNSKRRRERLVEQLKNAPEKEYKLHPISVPTTDGTIDPRQSLISLYTNDVDQMICQICKKNMPFRKRDGKYYFEAVEALSNNYFSKEHEAQFLALCPVCAAMYKEFVKYAEEAMKTLKDALIRSDKPEVRLCLGDWETSVQFVESHWHDIRTILQAMG